MFGVGTQELIVILLIALIVVGPQKLPELARQLGKGIRELRKVQDEVRDMVKVDLNPEPPTAYRPGVSGPKTPTPHRSVRPAASTSPAPPSATAPEPGAAPEPSAEPPTAEPALITDEPPADEPEGPTTPSVSGAD